jgi:prepilin signal peptidase PulO-like enzyme (type II secretory pathway)
MDTFLVLYRVIAVALIGVWARALFETRGKPVAWVPRGYERSPFRMTRDRYRFFSVIGVFAGFSVLAWSFVLSSG